MIKVTTNLQAFANICLFVVQCSNC